MATLDELSRALVAADKAGDTAAARILAGEITRMRSTAPKLAPIPADPTEGMSGFDKFAAGMGKAMVDTARGVGQIGAGVADFFSPRQLTLSNLVTGEKPLSRVEEARQAVADARRRDAPLMNTGAGVAGDVVGNLAMLAPTAMIPGAATIRGGAAIGAGTGLIQPSTSTNETVQNTLLGFGSGAAVPAAVRGVQTARAAAEPFYEAGQRAIVGRALNRAAGQDAPAVAARLNEAAAPFVGPSRGAARTTMGEFVPGSVPTVGQAAGNPGIAALERAATAGNPEVTNAVAQTMQAQNAARVGVLERLAGTDAERAAALKARGDAADPLYEAAKGTTYTVDAQLQELLKRPSVQQAVARARQIAEEESRRFEFPAAAGHVHGAPKAAPAAAGIVDEAGNVLVDLSAKKGPQQVTGTTLQDLKMGLDALLKDPTTGIAGKEAANIQKTRAALIKWMEEAGPDFKAARTTFSAKSQPLNEMDVAGALRDRAVSPLTGNLQPASYARALTDEGLPARATGFPAASYANSVSPAGQNQLNSLLLDVQRANAAQTVGRGVGSDTVQKLAYSNILDQAGVPTIVRALAPAQVVGNIGARAADAAYGRANRELSARLAEVMLDPAQAAQLMMSASPAVQNELLRLAARAGSGVALSAPALANAKKQ